MRMYDFGRKIMLFCLQKRQKKEFLRENICVCQKKAVILRPIVFIFTQTYKNLQ